MNVGEIVGGVDRYQIWPQFYPKLCSAKSIIVKFFYSLSRVCEKYLMVFAMSTPEGTGIWE